MNRALLVRLFETTHSSLPMEFYTKGETER